MDIFSVSEPIFQAISTVEPEILAQRVGGGGQQAPASVQKIVSYVLGIVAVVAGVGFFVRAGLEGWGKNPDKKAAFQYILVGATVASLLGLVSALIAFFSGIIGGSL